MKFKMDNEYELIFVVSAETSLWCQMLWGEGRGRIGTSGL